MRFSVRMLARISPDLVTKAKALKSAFPEVYPSVSQVIRAGINRLYLEKFNIDRIKLDTTRKEENETIQK